MKKVTIQFLLVIITFGSVHRVEANLKTYFPLSNETSFPRLVFGALPAMHEYTFCAWIRPHRLDVEYPYIFSYATSRSHNELTVLLQKTGSSYLGYVQMVDPFASFNCYWDAWSVGTWQHICVTWLGADGTTKFYANGKQCVATGSTTVSPRSRVLEGGVAMLGQDQDDIGGKFEASQAWYGDIARANLWNEVLGEHQIKKAAKCDNIEGNVIAWSKTAMHAYDGVVLTNTKLCDPDEHDIKPH